MKLKLSPLSIGILLSLIALTIVMMFLGFRPKEALPPPPANYYKCGERYVPFRANISDCLAVPVVPSESAVTGVVMNPNTKHVYILVNPAGSDRLGLAAYEIFKTLPKLYVSASIAYTREWPNQTNIAVMSLENASADYPIIMLEEAQNSTYIEVDGVKVIVKAKTSYDLDAAACRIAMLAITDAVDCSTSLTK